MKLFKCRHRYAMADFETDYGEKALYFIHRCLKCGEEYIIRIEKSCGNCLYRKTDACPSSYECYSRKNKPHWVLDDGEENKELQKNETN